jgi:2-polyprenyl-6-hydroxyphenyl methylase/3-demethylubiquinone-9 3-methyltransferase
MNKKTTKKQEFLNFSQIAKEWWDPEGEFKILHQILPIRMEYIVKNIGRNNIKNLEILDLGCGGGLTCEALARLNAKVTGIDFVKENIEIAKNHAIKSKLKINYINEDIDLINFKKKYDAILLLEVIEHLDDWQKLINKIKKNLKPGGLLILSTINRTKLSKIFAIFVAENILKWVPKNTHDYNKLVTPIELKKSLIENNFKIKNINGINFNLLIREWELSDKKFYINYFCTAKLN